MKKILISGLLVIFTMTQYACKKALDALPAQAKVQGNLIEDQKSAEVALNGVYLMFAEKGLNYTKNHEIVGSWLAGNIDWPRSDGTVKNNNLNASSTVSLGLWNGNYGLVNAANGFITELENLPVSKFTGARKTEMLAEAHFLRAYGHYKLLSFFGQFYDQNSLYGALIRDQFVGVDNIAKARSSVKESYDLILADLDDAIINAPLTNKTYYVNKWAAKALKARILLNRGATGDYASVITLTQDIISNSPYILENNLVDIFASKGLDSKEVILGTTPIVNQLMKTNTYFSPNVGAIYYEPTPRFRAQLQGDPRNNWLIGTFNNNLMIAKYKGTKLEYTYTLRLTEMYLTQAEAIARSGLALSPAKTLLKTVMQRAGVTDFTAVDAATTPDQLIKEIYNETVKNLSFEDGQDWFALLRFPLTTITTLKPTIVSKNQLILPVPLIELQRNQSFGPQNPGYDN